MGYIENSILSGLKAEFIHLDPMKAISGLTPETARKRPHNNAHSCWELLYHIVIWNDIFLDNIKGNPANWDPANNWPPKEELQKDDRFYWNRSHRLTIGIRAGAFLDTIYSF